MARTGRPTKYTDAMGDLLIKTFTDGHFVGSFCADAGIHKDTFWEWIKKHPDFSDAYKRAKACGDKHYTKMLRLIAGGQLKGNVTAAIYLTKCGLKWRDDEVEVQEVDEVEFYG